MYPGPAVTSSSPAEGAAACSSLRSVSMYVWSVVLALAGGRLPHSSSTSAETGTIWLR